jgi:hypothetical protein
VNINVRDKNHAMVTIVSIISIALEARHTLSLVHCGVIAYLWNGQDHSTRSADVGRHAL